MEQNIFTVNIGYKKKVTVKAANHGRTKPVG
jgi:hypothetical protein